MIPPTMLPPGSLYLLLALLGLGGGFFSGLLGLGGSILMVPLLLAVPQLFGFPALEMRTVAGISIAQVTAASLAAVLVHARQNAVSQPLVLLMGTTGAAASFLGGIYSERVESATLLLLFAVVASVGALMMFIPRREVEQSIPANQVPFNRPLAVVIAVAVGLIGGLIGAAGAFIYVPLLLYVLNIPTRITLGSTLAVVLISALAGLIGKLMTGQVPLGLSAALVVGAIPGARWGGITSRRFSAQGLHRLMTAVVLFAAVKLWSQVVAERGLTLTPDLLYGIAVAASVAAVIIVLCWRLAPGARMVPQFRLMNHPPKGEASMPTTAVQPGRITADEVIRLLGEGRSPRIVDVREPEEVAEGIIPGAMHIPLGEFSRRLAELDPEQETVIVCRSGNRSAQACELASRAGYRVRNFEGGMMSWRGPVERPS